MDEELFGAELSVDDAAEAFLKDLNKAEETPDPDPEETEVEDETEGEEPEEEPEGDTDDEAEGEDEEGSEEPAKKAAPKVADDDAEVTVEVDGKEIKVAVKDLKRLYGQEASLTQKSQVVAAQKKALETQGLYLAKILQDRITAAQEKAAKYKDVDLFRASRELEPEEFDALRAAKQAAESEVAALEREGQEFLQRSMQTRQAILREQAKESLKEITKAIPEWNDQLYGEIRTYAVSQGMDADLVNEVIDPGAIKMIHKAMLYDRAQQKKETVTKKVVKAPSRTLTKTAVEDRGSTKVKALRARAASTGSIDDVTEAFVAAMKD